MSIRLPSAISAPLSCHASRSNAVSACASACGPKTSVRLFMPGTTSMTPAHSDAREAIAQMRCWQVKVAGGGTSHNSASSPSR